jgi:hypothetical protein
MVGEQENTYIWTLRTTVYILHLNDRQHCTVDVLILSMYL